MHYSVFKNNNGALYPEDSKEIQDWYRTSPWMQIAVRGRGGNYDVVLLWVEDNEVKGFVCLVFDDGDLFIQWIKTFEEGKGTGSKILDALEGWVKQNLPQYDTIYLEPFKGNDNFYIKHNYIPAIGEYMEGMYMKKIANKQTRMEIKMNHRTSSLRKQASEFCVYNENPLTQADAIEYSLGGNIKLANKTAKPADDASADEKAKWKRAIKIVEEQTGKKEDSFEDKDWALVTTISKGMKPGWDKKSNKTATRAWSMIFQQGRVTEASTTIGDWHYGLYLNVPNGSWDLYKTDFYHNDASVLIKNINTTVFDDAIKIAEKIINANTATASKKTSGVADIYSELIDAGVPQEDIEHYNSDLYVRKTPLTDSIVAPYKDMELFSAFIDDIDGAFWYEFPLCYTPHFTEASKTASKKAGYWTSYYVQYPDRLEAINMDGPPLSGAELLAEFPGAEKAVPAKGNHVCQYCHSIANGPDEDALCESCRQDFGHTFYSEL